MEASTEPTATLTNFQTQTDVVSIVTAPVASVEANQGPYSFAELSGRTTSLGGKKPPASEPVVVLTKAITVLPVPTSAYISPPESSLTASYSTLSTTSTTFKVFTETRTESSSTSLAAAKPFTGVATYGWNSTLTTLLTVATGAKQSGGTYPTGHPHSNTGHSKPPKGSDYSWPRPQMTGTVPGSLAERQVGAVVVATIEGQVVSWTNSYGGQRRVSTPRSAHSSPTAVEETASSMYAVRAIGRQN